jgi:hypothetical protein
MIVLQLRLFNVQPRERASLVVFLVLTAANAISLEGAYIVATSGFLKRLRVEQFPILWLVDMAIILVISGLYTLIVDRVPRLKLVRSLVLCLVAIYLIFRLLFVYGVPDWLTYPGLYLLAEQQYTIFLLAFWALANDRFSVAQSKRLFPLIAGGGLVGQIIGSGLAGGSAKFFARRGIHPSELLTVNALLFLLAYAMLVLAARHVTVRARQETGHFRVREMLTTGFDFVRKVPSFRYLATAMLCMGFVLAIIEYHFLFTSDQAFTDAAGFQAFYGTYRMVLALGTLGVQGLLTGWLLKQAGLKNTFLILPATLLAAMGWMLAVPGIIGGATGRFLGRLVLVGVDRPTRQTLQGLIPEERRGRVSTFMNSYLYVVGSIFGSTVLGATILATAFGWLEESIATLVYLMLAIVVAVVAVRSAWRMRAVYDESLLDWRLARRRRRGSTLIGKKLDDLSGGKRESERDITLDHNDP